MCQAYIFVLLIVCSFEANNAQCPNGIISKGLSENDRNAIVKKHNELRSLISEGKLEGQPKGTNLKKMKYSLELEKKAQEIANSCKMAHQTVTGTQWKWVGQNLYSSGSTAQNNAVDWNGAIQAWFDEHKVYKFGAPFSMNTGHYTQVAWAETDHVGCGYTYYKNGRFNTKLYVCNYGPGGNFNGQNPYKTV